MELPEAGDLQVMFTEEEILKRVRELGAEISGDYAGQVPVLVAIL